MDTVDPAAIAERGALFATWPELTATIPWRRLGRWPSPLEAHRILPPGARPDEALDLLVKREDLSADGYGGNKIRPLEVVFGAMAERGLSELWSTGAYGSNHALAAAIHARRLGLDSGAVLWPQPWSQTAHDNLVVTATLLDHLELVDSVVSMVPRALSVRARRRAWVMPPGAATPLGALGHVNAALELSHQLRERDETIGAIVLPVGSTCTTVGLLVGTALAHAVGLLPALPDIVAVRVTPWPVTDRNRIAAMAVRTARLLAERFRGAGLREPGTALMRPESPWSEASIARAFKMFRRRTRVVGDELGPGYGQPTPSGYRALAAFAHAAIRLDTTYSAKAAAHLFADHGSAARGRVVFWSTKSANPLPPVNPAQLARLPEPLARWLGLH